MENISNVFMDVLNDIAEQKEELDLPTNSENTAPFVPIKGLKRNPPKVLIDTGNMTHEQFSIARQDIQKELGHTVFGGSDTGKVLGLSSWGTAQRLYVEKTTGKSYSDDSDSWILAAGHALEAACAELTIKYWKKHGNHSVVMLNDTGMYQCQTKNADGTLRYPFAVGNLDRIILMDGKKGVQECKSIANTGATKAKRDAIKKGICPSDYESQCRYYMAIMNLDFTIISFIWGNTEADFASFIIRRDFELEQNLMESMRDFWLHVERKEEPDYKNYNALSVCKWYRKYYSIIDTTLPELDLTGTEGNVEELLAIDTRIKELTEQINELKERKADIHAEWLAIFKEAGKGQVTLSDGRNVQIERKVAYKTQTLDLERLEKEKKDLYLSYLTAFDTDKFKADYPDLYEEYLTPKVVNPNSTSEPFKIRVSKAKKGKVA